MTSQFPGAVKNPVNDHYVVFATTEEKVSRKRERERERLCTKCHVGHAFGPEPGESV